MPPSSESRPPASPSSRLSTRSTAACQQGRHVRFFTVTGLVTQLLERREDRQLERFHKQLERCHLVVLDELGYIPCSKAAAELFFDVVSRAYERTSLLVTTSLPFEQWTDVMGSERLRPGEHNDLVIAVANTRGDRAGCVLRGYSGQSAGIYRPVSLKVTGRTRITSCYISARLHRARLFPSDLHAACGRGDVSRQHPQAGEPV